jgi:hypothetical protein
MHLIDPFQSSQTVGPRRVLLYGTRGIGTTTLAAALPSAVVVPCDDGVAHVDCRRFAPARRLGQLLRALHELCAEPHAFGTVVIDPLDGVERLALDEAAREHGVEHPQQLPFARGYALAVPYWRQLLESLDRLLDGRGMHCVLVGHARAERWTDGGAGGGTFVAERYGPAVHRSASALLQDWCDEVLYAAIIERPLDADAPDDHRAIHARPARSHAAKNRLGLPPLLPMRATALAPHFAPAGPPQATAAAQSAQPFPPKLNLN